MVEFIQTDTTQAAREAGIRHPVAMTIESFTATVSEIRKPLSEGQDMDGRLWDVLWMLSLAVKGSRECPDRVTFKVRVWDGQRHNEVRLWSWYGPGDNGSPVMTIMLED